MKYKCCKCAKEYDIPYEPMKILPTCCGYYVYPVSWDKHGITAAAVVERFNELWSDNRVAAMPLDGKMVCSFALVRPAPRYRPYNTSDEFKLADFCGKKVRAISDDLVFTIQGVGFDRMWVDGCTYTWNQMFGTFVWADTGEPFGVRED